jgi:hypothetical protein
MVSELGELGTKTQFLFTIGLTLCGLLTIPFVIGLYKSCRIIGLNPIPILIILFNATLIGPAIFPFPLHLHGILGMPSILVVLSPLMSLILWNKKIPLISFRIMAILSFLVISLGFLIFDENILREYFGLKQRFFHIGWSVWFIYLSYSFTKLQHNNN